MASAPHAFWRSMRERSIRVLVTPTPVTFAERRTVLQVLEQHGPVEVFKMTPRYHSNFVSVTKDKATATTLVASSPLTYSIAVSRAYADMYLADAGEPASHGNKPTGGQAASGAEAAPPGDSDGSAQRELKKFRLEIFPQQDFNHEFAMSGSPLHHSWPDVYAMDRSFVAATLKQSLPQTIATKGLSHWFLDLSRTYRAGHKTKRLQLKSWRPSRMKKELSAAGPQSTTR